MTEKYLGDAVYISYDGYQLKLTCAAPPGIIYLEPAVLIGVINYATEIGMIKQRNQTNAT